MGQRSVCTGRIMLVVNASWCIHADVHLLARGKSVGISLAAVEHDGPGSQTNPDPSTSPSPRACALRHNPKYRVLRTEPQTSRLTRVTGETREPSPPEEEKMGSERKVVLITGGTVSIGAWPAAPTLLLTRQIAR